LSTRGQHPEVHTIGIPEPEASALKEFATKTLQERDEAVSNLRCAAEPIGCGKEISPEEFATYSPLDKKEYSMSGLCLPCQDNFFGSE
jgi:hypothetical protein